MKKKLVVVIATVLILAFTVSTVSAEDSLNSTIDSISVDEGNSLMTSDTTSLNQEAVNADEYKSSTVSGETIKITAKIPEDLLNDIDEKVDSLTYVNDWGISKDQFKIMLAVLAWGEGNAGGYAAHSFDSTDKWHKDLPNNFHFSGGLGPFQITDAGGWTTIKKLNSKEALENTTDRHEKLGPFNNLEEVRYQLSRSQYYAYRLSNETNNPKKPLGNFEVKWKEATGTKWDDVKNTNKKTKDSPLDWTKIKEQLKSNELESEAIKDIGIKKWTISKEDNVKNYKGNTIKLNKNLRTWLISAKKASGKNLMNYYYTYDDVQKIEIWAYSNPNDEKHNKKSIFVRTYNKPKPYVQRSPDNDGFTLNHPVLTDSSIPTSDEFDFSDGFDFPVGWPNGDGYLHGTKNDTNGYDFLEYSTYSKSLHPGEDWNREEGKDDFGEPVHAVSNGSVVAAKFYKGNLGNVILIKHKLQDGTTVWSQYAHLNEMLVKENDSVKRGQKIGTIGKGGKNELSPHLHFEIRKNILNPNAWPYGQSEEEILKNYSRPSDFINSHRPQTEMDEAEGNANVILVIDCSGSMYGTPISNAKSSAQQFIAQMESEDKAGVVSFSSSASRDYFLTTLTDNERDLIKKKINSISASGTTAIGSGLEFALNDLQDNGDKNSHQAIVLLSDGQHNTGKHPDKVIPSIKASNIQVYTIGLGYNFNERLLKDIAKETDGMYFYTPTESQLNQIYNKIAGKVLALDTANELTISMVTNDVMSVDVDIDSSMKKASFSTSWPGSNVDLVLYKPDGSMIDPSVADSDPTIEYLSGPTYKIYKVTDPESGKWTMELTATDMPTGGEDVYVAVRAESALSMLLSTDKDQYNQGEIVKITAGLSDVGTQITGADVKVNVTLPDSSIEQLTLYDDGGHGDGEAQDGVYSNYFTDTSLKGDYKVDATSTGSLPDGSQFTRINDASFEIIQGTSSISLSPENLSIEGKAGEQITKNFTVSTYQASTSVEITPTSLQSENGDIIDISNIKVNPTTVNVSSGVPENILVTINIPESVISGNYTGKINANGVNGSDSCNVHLRVTDDNVTDTVEDNVTDTVDDNITDTIDDNVTDTVDDNITDTIDDNVTDTVGDDVTNTVGNDVTDTVNPINNSVYLYPANPTTGCIIFANHSESPTEGGWINLSGGKEIQLPQPLKFTYCGTDKLKISEATIELKSLSGQKNKCQENNTKLELTYPCSTHPFYTEKQCVTIDYNGPSAFKKQKVTIYLVKGLDVCSASEAFGDVMDNESKSLEEVFNEGTNSYTKICATLDENGDLAEPLAFGCLEPGNYDVLITLADHQNNKKKCGMEKKVISATCFEVVNYELETNTADTLDEGDNLGVEMCLENAPTEGEFTYGALLINKEAYKAEINVSSNGTRAGTDVFVNDIDLRDLGVNSTNYKSKLSKSELTNEIQTLIGEGNGTISIGEKNQDTLSLTTFDLLPGDYFLFTGAYEKGKGIVGIDQKELTIC